MREVLLPRVCVTEHEGRVICRDCLEALLHPVARERPAWLGGARDLVLAVTDFCWLYISSLFSGAFCCAFLRNFIQGYGGSERHYRVSYASDCFGAWAEGLWRISSRRPRVWRGVFGAAGCATRGADWSRSGGRGCALVEARGRGLLGRLFAWRGAFYARFFVFLGRDGG